MITAQETRFQSEGCKEGKASEEEQRGRTNAEELDDAGKSELQGYECAEHGLLAYAGGK